MGKKITPYYIRKSQTTIKDYDIVLTDGSYFRIQDSELLWELKEEELDLNIWHQYFKGGKYA